MLPFTRAITTEDPPPERLIAWGAKVSPDFKARVLAMAGELGTDADFLMSAMAFESGETFSASIRNEAGSGATGLIQFLPSTAVRLGTSVAALAAMTAEQQLIYVQRYLNPYKGRIATLEDLYMSILRPVAIGKPDGYVLFRSGTLAYEENAGLDLNKDGAVTKEEASAPVRAKLVKGREAAYVG